MIELGIEKINLCIHSPNPGKPESTDTGNAFEPSGKCLIRLTMTTNVAIEEAIKQSEELPCLDFINILFWLYFVTKSFMNILFLVDS